MTRICQGHEGYDCDVSLEGEHHNTVRCKPCGCEWRKAAARKTQSQLRRAASLKLDAFSLPGAQALKSQIENYWNVRGYRVECTLERGKYSDRWRQAPYFVRSNLVNGRPAKLDQTIGA